MSKQLHCSKDHVRHCSKQIQAIKYVELQGEVNAKDMQIEQSENTINRLRKLYVVHAKIPGLDNLGMTVRKYTSKDNNKHFDYPYYIVCIQRHAITTKRKWLQEKLPKRKEIVVDVNPNSVHAFNQFKEEDHIESCKFHFRLNDLTRDDLYDTAVPVIGE